MAASSIGEANNLFRLIHDVFLPLLGNQHLPELELIMKVLRLTTGCHFDQFAHVNIASIAAETTPTCLNSF